VALFIVRYANLSINNTKGHLVKGAIDTVSSSFDFQNEVLKLDGEWEFYFGGDSPPTQPPSYVKLKPWGKLGHQNIGTATYRAVVQKPAEIEAFGLKISGAYTNYKILINGKQINGISSPLADTKSLNITSDYHYFTAGDGPMEIIIQVQNTGYYIGGLVSAPILGIPKNIQLLKDISLALSVFLIACLTCMSIFIFSFYIAKDEENSIIYLGLASISYVIKVFLSTSGPLYFLYYTTPFYLLNKFLLISSVLTTLFIFEYFNSSFKRSNSLLPKTLRAILCVYIAAILISKPSWLYYIDIMMFLLTAISYTYAFIIALTDLFRHQQKAIFNFSGAVILIISFSLDIDSLDLSKYRIIGLLVFCILSLVNIINDYIATYNNLHQLKISLESEIESRTLELVTIHDNLEREMQARIVAEENLKSIPNYDISTGLFNTMYASNYLDAQISAFYRHNQIFSVIIYEIDGLKNIGQTFNSNFVERVVLESSDVIRQLLRKTDILARWRNDKFIIIMANCSEHSAISVAEKVNISISQNIVEGIGSVSLSLGVATVKPNDNSKIIIRRAEKNLELSKSNRKIDK
jgi:diguanylate cyclase (GGDEF)-like protein